MDSMGYVWDPWVRLDPMGTRGIHGHPWIPWVPIHSMGTHTGYPWNPPVPPHTPRHPTQLDLQHCDCRLECLCDFCGVKYRFDAVDVGEVFTPPDQQAPGSGSLN